MDHTSETPDTEEPSTLRWHSYVILIFIIVCVVLTFCYSLFTPWRLGFLALTLFILLHVYYGHVFVPYKPPTTVLSDSFLVLHVGRSFILGILLTHPTTRGTSSLLDIVFGATQYAKDDYPLDPIIWIILIEMAMRLPLEAVRKLPSVYRDPIDVKALTFFSVTCTLAAMVSSVLVTSLDIVPSWQNQPCLFGNSAH